MPFLPTAAQALRERFIGLDLAKRETQLSVLNTAGEEIAVKRFLTRREQFQQLADELNANDTVALEVTTNAFAVVRLLERSGARIILSNPIKTRVIAEAKIKTDKIDARVLAELARVNYLPSVWLPDSDTEALRHFCSDRRSLVDRRTELKNTVHSVLHRNLIPVSHSDLFGTGGQKWLESVLADQDDEAATNIPLDPIDRLRVRALLLELERLEQSLKELEGCIAAFIAARPALRAQLDHLLSIPGVSLVVGAGLLAAIGNVQRFHSPKRLAAYFGLVPATYQSGDPRRKHGPITKRGRAQARWLAVEAAEHLRKAPGPMRALYTRIYRKRGHNVAVTAVARKLTELVWYLLIRESDYLYQLPRLADEKRARVRFLARRRVGLRTPSAARKLSGRTALYGSGIAGRSFKTKIVRHAAKQAEDLYAAIVGNTHQPKAAKSIETESPNFDPTRPRTVDWELLLRQAATDLLEDHSNSSHRKEKRNH